MSVVGFTLTESLYTKLRKVEGKVKVQRKEVRFMITRGKILPLGVAGAEYKQGNIGQAWCVHGMPKFPPQLVSTESAVKT